MTRSHRRVVAAAALATSACLAATAGAQTPAPAPTSPAPPAEIPTAGAPIAPNGTDNTATPGANRCQARLYKARPDADAVALEGALVARYRLSCSSDVTGYAFAFNRTVTSASTEVFPTDKTTSATFNDQSFSCSGTFPGIGLSCTGTYRGGFNLIRGTVTFELTDDEVAADLRFCELDLAGTVSTFTSAIARDPYSNKALVNKDGTSQIRHLSAGPFTVTTPGCHHRKAGAAGAKAGRKRSARS